MESIEERADAYIGHPFEIDEFSSTTIKRQAFIEGAKEQRKIDIMRVRQFLEREVAYNGSMSCVDDLLIEELCKAMEE